MPTEYDNLKGNNMDKELTHEELQVLAQKPDTEMQIVTTDDLDEKDVDRVIL